MTKNSGLSYSTIFTPSPNGPGCRPSKRGNRRLGFTVIELIVCMGVVAVLCGILLPSLRATREAS
jgi:prepilin-type N-terminal cleavage/methylation domain-containing protein